MLKSKKQKYKNEERKNMDRNPKHRMNKNLKYLVYKSLIIQNVCNNWSHVWARPPRSQSNRERDNMRHEL